MVNIGWINLKLPDDTFQILISDIFEDDDRMRMLVLAQDGLEPWRTSRQDGLKIIITCTSSHFIKQAAPFGNFFFTSNISNIYIMIEFKTNLVYFSTYLSCRIA